MRELNVNGKQLRVRATPLALLYYRQAFGTDLLGDLVKMKEIEKDQTKMDSVAILQLVWAMAKADNGSGKVFPSFETWLSTITFDFTDKDLLAAIMEEAADGFFRRESRKEKRKR